MYRNFFKLGKFFLWICVCVFIYMLSTSRDRLLPRWIKIISKTRVTAGMYEEQSFLRDPALLQFVIQVLESLKDFDIVLEASLVRGVNLWTSLAHVLTLLSYCVISLAGIVFFIVAKCRCPCSSRRLSKCDTIAWEDGPDRQLLASMIFWVCSTLMLSLCSNDTVLSVLTTLECRHTSATYLIWVKLWYQLISVPWLSECLRPAVDLERVSEMSR